MSDMRRWPAVLIAAFTLTALAQTPKPPPVEAYKPSVVKVMMVM